MKKISVLIILVLLLLGASLGIREIEGQAVEEERPAKIEAHTVEIQVDGVDMICVWVHYVGGFGFSCDWPQNNICPAPIGTPVMPIPTSTPKPY